MKRVPTEDEMKLYGLTIVKCIVVDRHQTNLCQELGGSEERLVSTDELCNEVLAELSDKDRVLIKSNIVSQLILIKGW
jgi:hypothetical protein